MRILIRAVCLSLAVVMVGCGGNGMARVKGQIVDNGSPVQWTGDRNGDTVIFTLLDAEGKPVPYQIFVASIAADGRFEVVASGGELPVGTYQVGIDSAKSKSDKIKAFALPKSEARITFVAGANTVQIDLAKPKG